MYLVLKGAKFPILTKLAIGVLWVAIGIERYNEAAIPEVLSQATVVVIEVAHPSIGMDKWIIGK